MGLNIKNLEVERLAAELAGLTGESKTEAVRRALDERKSRLAGRVAKRSSHEGTRRFLEREIWPLVPPEERGRRTTKRRREAILGYGKRGV